MIPRRLHRRTAANVTSGLGTASISPDGKTVIYDPGAAYNDLAKVRNKDAAKSWLATLASHKCYHWKQKKVRQDYREIDGLEAEELEVHSVQDADFVEELERDQLVREAMFELSDRCREMIHLLFFTSPPLPYRDVAEKLGLAVGSIGFTRGRCLKQLQKRLEQKGC